MHKDTCNAQQKYLLTKQHDLRDGMSVLLIAQLAVMIMHVILQSRAQNRERQAIYGTNVENLVFVMHATSTVV